MTHGPLRPCDVDIDAERVELMGALLRGTDLRSGSHSEGWGYGMDRGWMAAIVDHWLGEFRWEAHVAAVRRHPNRCVDIDGCELHFLHISSGQPDAIPLLLLHGWPWTFWDWRHVLDLVNCTGAGPAFDVVVPSLPGFPYSGAAQAHQLGLVGTARLLVQLMHDVLGYDAFGVVGGDWGALIGGQLALGHQQHVLGLHLLTATYPGITRSAIGPGEYGADELWMMARNREAAGAIVGHVAVGVHELATLDIAWRDSPAGAAAWLLKRRRDWSGLSDHLEPWRGLDPDHLCATAAMYWLTATTGSSMRLYADHAKERSAGLFPDLTIGPHWDVPVAVTVGPEDVVLTPRAHMEARMDLRQWTVLPAGGHFLPLERPADVVETTRSFFLHHSRPSRDGSRR